MTSSDWNELYKEDAAGISAESGKQLHGISFKLFT